MSKERNVISGGRATSKYSPILGQYLPPVLLQELPDEALGQLAGVAEELLVKVVVHGRDVSQRLLLGVSEERGRTAQTERPMNTLTSDNVFQRTKI